MKPNQCKKLFIENVNQLNKMDLKSGSVVKAVLMALETNGPTYIRLLNPVNNTIEYDMVEGLIDLVKRVGTSLGISVSDTQLIVETKNVAELRTNVAKKRTKIYVESKDVESEST